MFCLPPHPTLSVLHCLLVFFSLVLLPGCARQRGPFPVSDQQGLRINTSETYAVSVHCECKDAGVCDTEEIQRIFTAGLRERGIRLGSQQKATRTLALKCSKAAPGPRNEPPLAPGSRLWYQRRIFAPSSSRSSGSRPVEGSLKMEIFVRRAQYMDDRLPTGELKANMVIADTSASTLRRAIDFLITSIQ